MSFGPRSRIVGVDDGPFDARPRAKVPVVGVLMRGTRVEGVMTTRVVRHGIGATGAIARMLTTGRLGNQAQAVVLDGVAVGGFNVIDLPLLAEAVGVPVVAVMRKEPDLDAIRHSLRVKTRQPDRRWRMIERAGAIHSMDGMYFQVAGATPGLARRILTLSCPFDRYPEALRLAHFIAGAHVFGSSRGGA